MSVPFGSNVLTFSEVVKPLRTTFETFTDRRWGKNTRYTLVDAGLSAFSVFFMQGPSFLERQRTMSERRGKKMPRGCSGCIRSRRTIPSVRYSMP